MNNRKLVFGFLLLSALASTAACQTPINHLISVLGASTQELQAAAQLSSAQQAYSTITRIVNEIFKAMQRMSLPYYQSQLTFLSNQQISLSNRLAALQASVSNNANMLFRMTGAVSSSLAAQTANIGSVVMNYRNNVQPRIDQLEHAIQGIADILPTATASIETLQSTLDTTQIKLTTATDALANMMTQLNNMQIANQLYKTTYTDVLVASDTSPGPAALPYCRRLTLSYPPMIQTGLTPSVGVFSFPLESYGVPLDIAIEQMNQNNVVLLLCDRSKATFTFIPTRIVLELMVN